MGLMDALRRAEEQGRDSARRGYERAKDTFEDAERRIRRRMRIFPTSYRSGRADAAQPDGMKHAGEDKAIRQAEQPARRPAVPDAPRPRKAA